MRLVKFRKAVRDGDEYHTPYYIEVILRTDESGGLPHDAMDYLEAAIKALPENIGEPAVVEHILGICEGCNHAYPHGQPCPVQAYIETEVNK